MDEGERYIEGKSNFLNEHYSGDLALQKEALFTVKTDVSAMKVEENHYQNFKRSFSNSLKYTHLKKCPCSKLTNVNVSLNSEKKKPGGWVNVTATLLDVSPLTQMDI